LLSRFFLLPRSLVGLPLSSPPSPSSPPVFKNLLASALELSSPKGSGRGPTRRRRLYLEPTPSTPLTHLFIFASSVLILPLKILSSFRQLSHRLRRRPTTTSSLSLFMSQLVPILLGRVAQVKKANNAASIDKNSWSVVASDGLYTAATTRQGSSVHKSKLCDLYFFPPRRTHGSTQHPS
jgi:hypothetical protein